MASNKRYFFAQDKAGDWYQIPANLREKWEELKDLPEPLEMSALEEFEEYRLDGGIEHITFFQPFEEIL